MEVASGEHGEVVNTLVIALNSGKNGNTVLLTENEAGIQLQGISSVSKHIANDISKRNSNIQQTILTVANQTSISPTSTLSNKYTKNDHTVINLSNSDEHNTNTQNKVLPPEVCTQSLLDSHDSVITLPNKKSFPTSGWRQFCM